MDAKNLQEILNAHKVWLQSNGAYGTRANLADADLAGTCLSTNLYGLQRMFCKQCPTIGKHGGKIVYRTAESQHVGSTQYVPGNTYVAPYLSFSSETECHPGIYAGSLEWMLENYSDKPLVKCYVRDGDWVISAKGAIRCKRLRVLSNFG